VGSLKPITSHSCNGSTGSLTVLVCCSFLLPWQAKDRAPNLTSALLLYLCAGTPVQNNLLEYYALLSWAAPGLLGAAAAFVSGVD
jgi:hypothetical protein